MKILTNEHFLITILDIELAVPRGKTSKHGLKSPPILIRIGWLISESIKTEMDSPRKNRIRQERLQITNTNLVSACIGQYEAESRPIQLRETGEIRCWKRERRYWERRDGACAERGATRIEERAWGEISNAGRDRKGERERGVAERGDRACCW